MDSRLRIPNNGGTGSLTVEQQQQQQSSSSDTPATTNNQQTHTLRLRGAPIQRGPNVRWQEGTVDNEHMNKKKSKS